MPKYMFADDCPSVENHTASPSQYNAWVDWADKMDKTHIQTQCPDCKFWVIWKEKLSAQSMP